ncbi:hypothetical protein D3C72_1951250 [compost metagenome]
MTRSPTLNAPAFSPTAATTPAASPPGENGNGGWNWYLPSMIRVSGKLTPAACTSSRISFFFGTGLATSSSTRSRAGPRVLHNTAFIGAIPLRVVADKCRRAACPVNEHGAP